MLIRGGCRIVKKYKKALVQVTEYSQVNNAIWVGELLFMEREREREIERGGET